MRLPSRITRHVAVPIAISVGLLGSGALIWQSTYAAFTGTTANPTNKFASGKVALSDNLAGSSMFTVSGLVPGSSGVACIDVTYSGTVASSVKLYGTNDVASPLSQYLTFQVDQIGSSAPCTTASASVASLYGGSGQTLAGLTSSNGTYATGLGTWTPSTTTTQRYRFAYSLQDNNAAQSQSSQVTFTWEARSTG